MLQATPPTLAVPASSTRLSLCLGLTALTITAGLAASGFSSPDNMRDLFGKSTYYILWYIFLLWLVHFDVYLKSKVFSWKQLFRGSWPVLVAALLMTLVTAFSIPPKFRVLSDETNLASVSRSMVYSKTVFNFTIGKYFNFGFTPVTAELEKRPMLFPFLAHLVHLVRGYSVQNLFIVNLSLLYILLAGVGIQVRNTFAGCRDSIGIWPVAMILVLLCPIVTLTATSAGFDFFSAVFFSWTFLVLASFLRNPNAEHFAFLWLNLVLLSHIRYESIIFFVIVLAGLCWFRMLRREYFLRYPGLYLSTPLAFLPLLFQRIISRGKYENPVDVPVFALKHLTVNVQHFFSAISDFTFFYPYPNYLIWAALLLIPPICWKWFRDRRPAWERRFTLLLLASMACYLLIVFAFYLGDPKHPSSARFFVLPVAALALLPVIAHAYWPNLFHARALLAASIGMYLLYQPVAIRDRFTQTLEQIRETEHARNYLERHQSGNLMVIADRPGIYSALQYGTVNFDYANKNRKVLLEELQNNLYSGIMVLQNISYSSGKPLANQDLDPEYVLAPPVAEIQITGDYYLRISPVRATRRLPPIN